MTLHTLAIFVLVTLLVSCSIQDPAYEKESYNCTNDFVIDNTQQPMNIDLTNALTRIQKQGLVGVSVLIKNANGFWASARGKADIDANAAFQTCTLSAIGSTTKTMVAAITLRVQEAGLLSISDRASDYLDEEFVDNIDNLNSATIEQLLNHTSGIYNYTNTIAYLLDMMGNLDNPDHALNIKDRLEYIYGVDAIHKVGQGHHYSNTNYLLLDLVLQRATGKSLAQLFQDELITPLGLSSTIYDPSVNYTPGQAQGYFDAHGNGTFRNNTLAEGGARTAHGGALSNVFDLYTFFNAILDVNTGYLAQSSIDAMQNWVPFPYDNVSKDTTYGLGLGKKTTANGTVYSHAGLLPNGYNADIRYYVEEQTTVIYLTNAATASFAIKGLMNDFTNTIESILFGL